MTDDLIARLRWWGEHGVSGSLNDLVEAADRIEELESWKAAEEAHHHMLRAEAAENARIIGMSAEREMALRGEVERLAAAVKAQMDGKHKEAAEANLWFTKAQEWKAEVERLREALRVMIYETTHLSPMRPDGSHWCRITADALNIARAALEGTSHDD